MSRVFNAIMNDISTASGCDWDFVISMYNRLWEKHDDVDFEQFEQGVIKRDWSVRGNWRFENVLVDLSEKSGYTCDYLLGILADMIYDPDDEGTIDEFITISLERDW